MEMNGETNELEITQTQIGTV